MDIVAIPLHFYSSSMPTQLFYESCGKYTVLLCDLFKSLILSVVAWSRKTSNISKEIKVTISWKRRTRSRSRSAIAAAVLSYILRRKQGCKLFFNRRNTIQYFRSLRSSRQALLSHNCQFLCFAKVFLSHRLQAGIQL